MGRLLTGALALAIAAAAVFAGRTLLIFNAFDTIENDFDGLCQPVVGLVGPEDLQIVPGDKTVFVSSHDRIAVAKGEATRGGIYAFSLNDPLGGESWRDRTGGAPSNFLPHGIFYYQNGELRRLFVVNMATTSVEIYDVSPDYELTHAETVTSPMLTSPNDVFATGPRTFYVTNDVEAGRDTLLGTAHALLQKPTGTVYLFRDGEWSSVASGLRFANGIAVNAAGDRAYVAEASGKSVALFARSEDGALDPMRTFELDTSVDNINLDAEGDLWIGAHPKPLELQPHERDLDHLSPSEVVRVRFGASAAEDERETVFLDDGRLLSGSTSAARAGDHLIIGALYQEKFLVCQMGATLPRY
ncbi:MAG: SMP-30/gluconolactonase/LRE family protein [Pseudomonadota bacterium]